MEQPKRPGLKAGVMTEFTVFTNVTPGHEKAVRETIKQASHNPRRAEAVQEIGTLHEARFVLFDNDRRLMFCSSFDGSWDKYIDDFATTYIANIFDAVFSHCEGYPGRPSREVRNHPGKGGKRWEAQWASPLLQAAAVARRVDFR